MQRMNCESSSEVAKVCYLEEHPHVYEEIQMVEENLESKGNNKIVFPSQEASGSSDIVIKLYHNSVIRDQELSDDPHLLNIPSIIYDDSDIIPCQFDRHAPGRISTSPTLRRLRNSMSSVSQVFPLQNGTETTQLNHQVLQSGGNLPVCHSSPPGPQHQLSSSYSDLCKNPLLQQESSSQVDHLSVPSHRVANFIDSQTVQKMKGCKPYFQCEEKENSQECVQVIDLHKSRGLHSSTERRPSSVVVSFPGLKMFPGDLLVSDSAAEFLHHSVSLQNSESKKAWWPFAKKGTSKDKHKQVSDLKNCLSTVTIKMFECNGYEFQNFKDKTWHEIMKVYKPESKATGDELNIKKTEVLWEFFTTECTYFLDHLLVLKTIFMDTLKYLQRKEFLSDVESRLLFANLEQLNQVSFSFVTEFFNAMKDHLVTRTPSSDVISVLTKYFHGDLCECHQIYCLNYTSAVFYLEKLKKREDFEIYLKWCEQNECCRRLHLSELLVAPLHKLTRYPLLLKKICKNASAVEKARITIIQEKVEKSIRDLEGKVKWLDNYQKFKQLQEIIIWPSLWDQDKRFFVPDCLKHILKGNPDENIFSPTKRFLLHEGKLTLAEHMKLSDVYVFLFSDLLLITKPHRHKKVEGQREISGFISYMLKPNIHSCAQVPKEEKSGVSDLSVLHICPFFSHELQSLLKEGVYCAVIDQPIPLDRLTVKNIDLFHLSVFGLQNAFLIQHENSYQQCIAAFLLQAQTESIKKIWMSQMEIAISNYAKRHRSLPAESAEI